MLVSVSRLRRVVRVAAVVVAAGCGGNGWHPTVIPAPVGDSVAGQYVAAGATYQCRRWKLYDRSGPDAQGCGARRGDTVWVVYRDRDKQKVLAAGREYLVPIDSLDVVAARIAADLTGRYGAEGSCASNAATIRGWRWWAAGAYTVQLRVIDPTSVYPVKRGRVEEQAIPADAVVCLTWVHEPLP